MLSSSISAGTSISDSHFNKAAEAQVPGDYISINCLLRPSYLIKKSLSYIEDLDHQYRLNETPISPNHSSIVVAKSGGYQCGTHKENTA